MCSVITSNDLTDKSLSGFRTRRGFKVGAYRGTHEFEVLEHREEHHAAIHDTVQRGRRRPNGEVAKWTSVIQPKPRRKSKFPDSAYDFWTENGPSHTATQVSFAQNINYD